MNKNVVCYLPGVDALRAGYVFPLKQSPVHLDVPGEGVAGTQNGKNDPEREDSIVVCWYVVFTDSRNVCVCEEWKIEGGEGGRGREVTVVTVVTVSQEWWKHHTVQERIRTGD